MDVATRGFTGSLATELLGIEEFERTLQGVFDGFGCLTHSCMSELIHLGQW